MYSRRLGFAWLTSHTAETWKSDSGGEGGKGGVVRKRGGNRKVPAGLPPKKGSDGGTKSPHAPRNGGAAVFLGARVRGGLPPLPWKTRLDFPAAAFDTVHTDA